jgi:hypothetical protein
VGCNDRNSTLSFHGQKGNEQHHYLKKERTEQLRIEGSEHLKLSDIDQSAQLPYSTSIRNVHCKKIRMGKDQKDVAETKEKIAES